MLQLITKTILNEVFFKLVLSIKKHPKKYSLFLYRFLIATASTFIIIVVGYVFLDVDLKKMLFLHKNSHVVRNIDADAVKQEMVNALLTMGKGATISKLNVGFANLSDVKKTISFEEVISCQFKAKDCLFPSKIVHPQWYTPSTISKIDDNNIEKNKILLYTTPLKQVVSVDFSENTPVCITIFKNKNDLDIEFLVFQKSFPSLAEKIESISFNLRMEEKGSYIHKACFNKIRHPQFNNVVYMFLFTFWYHSNKAPDMLNYNKVKNLLKGIGDKEKQALIRIYAL